MIKNPSYKADVKLAKDKAAKWSCENLHHVDNVNVAQGPKTGNKGTPTKRSDFVAGKQERAPLADHINNAFAARAQDDKINSKLEPVSANTKAKFKK